MITIAASQGSLLRSLPESDGSTSYDLGFHPLFGFIPEQTLSGRLQSRRLRGLPAPERDWAFRFRVEKKAEELSVTAVRECSVERLSATEWKLLAKGEELRIAMGAGAAPVPGPSEEGDPGRKIILGSLALGLALFSALLRLAPESAPVAEPEVQEPVTVKIRHEAQRPVVVPRTRSLERASDIPTTVSKEVRRAVQQDLGFLGVLGRKDLRKALGGAPTTLGASRGAGQGGSQGSGGEVLQGLGQGVKRTTVGNSGLAGLGGVGTKGAGGGAGGYGNAMVGSGDGKGLTTIPISEDVVLEGGLDKSVIQATIAKYLSQVRACYEAGLRVVPGLTGQVSVSFEVGASGGVGFSRVTKSSLGNAAVENCITGRMMGWQFPRPRGGMSVRVNYPFLLRPVGT